MARHAEPSAPMRTPDVRLCDLAASGVLAERAMSVPYRPARSMPRVDVAVLVPVKDFRQAKVRLAGALAPSEREALARSMAANVVTAARPLPVFVVCDDDAVATWARAAGASVLWRPGRGLNGAVTSGVTSLADAGLDRVIVAHSDLP